MIPTVQTAANVPRSRGFTAFPSMTMDGKLKVVTAIMKLKMVPNWALPKRLCHRDGPENIRVHGDAHQYGQNYAKGISASQGSLDPRLGDPVVDHGSDPHAARIYGNTFLKVDSTWSLA